MNDKNIQDVIDKLPMFDSVISELLQLINDERTTAAKLEKIIKNDPVLSLKIIKLANSTYFSPVKPITSISHAVRFIGLSTLKSLVYSIALQSISDKNSSSSYVKDIQQKCLVNASVALVIGKAYLKKNKSIFTADDFYTFGLFHDIGLLAVANYDIENVYVPILKSVENGSTLIEAEKEWSHAFIGQKLMEKWEIPEIYSEFAFSHHTYSDENAKLYVPYKIIELAEHLSNLLGYDKFAVEIDEIDEYLDLLGIKKEVLFDEENELLIKNDVESLVSGFSV